MKLRKMTYFPLNAPLNYVFCLDLICMAIRMMLGIFHISNFIVSENIQQFLYTGT